MAQKSNLETIRALIMYSNAWRNDALLQKKHKLSSFGWKWEIPLAEAKASG